MVSRHRFAVLAVATTVVLASCTRSRATPAEKAAEVRMPAEATYIVVLKPSASPEATAERHAEEFGLDVNGVYTTVLKGYVARISTSEVGELRTDPSVAYVELDRTLRTLQTVPTGVRRIFAPLNANIDIDGQDDVRINADVAIVDTGVLSHSDLNVVSRANCLSGTCASGTGADDYGHGTHVAGSVAALDNSIGVVGVAPGARIHSLKVCTASGSCPNSAIIAALDYVTARAGTIEVVNMSLGGPGSNTPLAAAIARSVDAGIVYSVSAGNSNQDALGFSPANHPDVIAVSALADSDGKPGGVGGPPACRPSSRDDVLADFSNWGAVVDVAAPGVCILSTWNNGGYNTISGTSMSAPHVTGAAAILTSGTRDPTNRSMVLAVRDRIRSAGNYNWTDDSGDGVKEPLLDVHDATKFPPGAAPAPVTIFSDNFETSKGWIVNPYGTDRATSGRWERGDPQGTSYAGIAQQLTNPTSGANDLVTGRLAGTSVNSYDVDGGVTSVRSPAIRLPSAGSLTLSVQWYFAHLRNATGADWFRIRIQDGTTTKVVLQAFGAARSRPGTWRRSNINLTPYAGKTIRVLIEAYDTGTNSTIEAAVDDVVITQQL